MGNTTVDDTKGSHDYETKNGSHYEWVPFIPHTHPLGLRNGHWRGLCLGKTCVLVVAKEMEKPYLFGLHLLPGGKPRACYLALPSRVV